MRYYLNPDPEQGDREAKEDMAQLAPEYWAHMRALEEGDRIEAARLAAHEREVELDERDLRRAAWRAERYAEVEALVEAMPPRPTNLLPPRSVAEGW